MSEVVHEARVRSQSDHEEMPRVLWFEEQWKMHHLMNSISYKNSSFFHRYVSLKLYLRS